MVKKDRSSFLQTFHHFLPDPHATTFLGRICRRGLTLSSEIRTSQVLYSEPVAHASKTPRRARLWQDVWHAVLRSGQTPLQALARNSEALHTGDKQPVSPIYDCCLTSEMPSLCLRQRSQDARVEHALARCTAICNQNMRRGYQRTDRRRWRDVLDWCWRNICSRSWCSSQHAAEMRCPRCNRSWCCGAHCKRGTCETSASA